MVMFLIFFLFASMGSCVHAMATPERADYDYVTTNLPDDPQARLDFVLGRMDELVTAGRYGHGGQMSQLVTTIIADAIAHGALFVNDDSHFEFVLEDSMVCTTAEILHDLPDDHLERVVAIVKRINEQNITKQYSCIHALHNIIIPHIELVGRVPSVQEVPFNANVWGHLMQYVIDQNKKRVVSALLVAGASADYSFGSSGNALMRAVFVCPDSSIAKLLIEHKAQYNVGQGHPLGTPLHHAVRGCSPVNVKLLCDVGVDIMARDSNNHTPLDIAQTQYASWEVNEDGFHAQSYIRDYEYIIDILRERQKKGRVVPLLDLCVGALARSDIDVQAAQIPLELKERCRW